MSTPRHPWATLRRGDAGISLVELLVAIGLLAIVVGVGITVVAGTHKARTTIEDEAAVENAQLNATDALYLDVSDAVRLVQAEDTQMVVDIARPQINADGTQGEQGCVQKTWKLEDPQTITGDNGQTWQGANLVTYTRQYTSPDCNGDLGEAVKHVVIDDHLLTAMVPFTFYSRSAPETPMRTPISQARADDSNDLAHVVSMNVDVTARSTRMSTHRPMISGAAFGKMSAPGTGVQVVQLKAPVLRVITSSEDPARDAGVDKPILEWTDRTANVAAGWAIYALRYPSGVADVERGQYRQVGYVINDDPDSLTQTVTWTDRDLPDGSTGQYVVAAIAADQRPGPSSNMVITGLRPAAPDLTVKGRPTSIELTWPDVEGAVAFDVYRDGQPFERVGDVNEWTDPTGAGHVHTYQVVGVNRWESIWSCGSVDCRVDSFSDTLVFGNTASTRAFSAPKAAWTAPQAPTKVTAANRFPADVNNPASSWDQTVPVSWTAPAWTVPHWTSHAANDSGVSDAVFNAQNAAKAAADAALRYRVARNGTQVAQGQPATSFADGGAPRGNVAEWLVSASTVAGGNSAAFDHNADPAVPVADATTSLLTWPSAPSCTASPGGGGQPATRAATASAARPGGQAVASTRLRLAQDGSVQAGDVAAWTSLTHNTGWTWRAQASNAAGWGPWGAECGTSTALLTVGAPSCSVSSSDTTAPGSITVSGGSEVKLGSSGTAYPSPRTFSGLGGGTYTGYARNYTSDGVNSAYSGWSNCGSKTISNPPSSIGSGLSTADGSSPCYDHRADGSVRQGLYSSASSILASAYGSAMYISASMLNADHWNLTTSTATTYTCAFSAKYTAYWSNDGTPAMDVYGSFGTIFNISGGGIGIN